MVAVDNEQYVAWVRARWGIELQGGEGFATIAELLGSRVQYRRGDALALDGPAERFDVVPASGSCTGSRTRWGCCGRLAALLAPGGRLLVETYGIAGDGRVDAHTIEVQRPGGVYAGDEYVYWASARADWPRSPSWPAWARRASTAPSSWTGTRGAWRR